VVLETTGFDTTELSAYCRERGLFPEQVDRWRQAATDANEKPMLSLREQKELEKLRAQNQKEIKQLKQERRRKEKALAEAAALLIAAKKIQAFAGDGNGVDGRKGSHRLVAHRLSEEERQRILLTCNEPQYSSLPPGQIVPDLADQGRYIGSERSFYRILHAHG
jgi:transposase-like protein